MDPTPTTHTPMHLRFPTRPREHGREDITRTHKPLRRKRREGRSRLTPPGRLPASAVGTSLLSLQPRERTPYLPSRLNHGTRLLGAQAQAPDAGSARVHKCPGNIHTAATNLFARQHDCCDGKCRLLIVQRLPVPATRPRRTHRSNRGAPHNNSAATINQTEPPIPIPDSPAHTRGPHSPAPAAVQHTLLHIEKRTEDAPRPSRRGRPHHRRRRSRENPPQRAPARRWTTDSPARAATGAQTAAQSVACPHEAAVAASRWPAHPPRRTCPQGTAAVQKIKTNHPARPLAASTP